MINTHFSKNIRYLRMKQGMYQKTAADLIGISRPALGSYEEGRAEPPYNVLVRICEVYKIKNPLKIITEPLY